MNNLGVDTLIVYSHIAEAENLRAITQSQILNYKLFNILINTTDELCKLMNMLNIHDLFIYLTQPFLTTALTMPVHMKSVCLLLWFAFLAFNASSQTPCEALLQDGLYQKTHILIKRDFNQDIKTYFASEQFKSDMRKGEWGGSLGFTVNGVPLSIGANSSDSEFSSFTQKIQQSSKFSLTTSDYVSISKSLPNPDLYKAYLECQDIINPKSSVGQPLSTLSKIETKETVIFTFAFVAASTSTRTPKVISLVVTPEDAIVDNGGLEVGKKMPSNFVAVTCKRKETAGITVTLKTDNGTVTATSPATKIAVYSVPVGTIIASSLVLESFRQVNNEDGPWNSKSQWAPCDGREVSGSTYSRYAGRVPDLRGVFLRGLNTFDINPTATVPALSDVQKDPDNRQVGSFQDDELQSHTHGYTASARRDVSGRGGTSDFAWDAADYTSKATGGAETRPKNIAVFYYIKIN